jgi:hypothetical protein
MTSNKALITRPQHDEVTDYFAWWSNEIIEFAASRGIKMIDLGAEDTTKDNFERYIADQMPSLIIINGHGDSSCFAGHKDEPLVTIGVNEAILKGKIAYIRACSCAAELGPAAIDAGADAFIGYRLPFCFLTNKNMSCTPEDDYLANIFKDPSNLVALSLLKGCNVGEADKRSKDKYLELIRRFGASNADPDAPSIRRWLFWNMRAQSALGNPQATF